ncbi:hypothetical protein [Methyloterricola oryzae]|uniref:hypothetical protein n=1 Tax=Methyloterricola oryzae TaxID=1495050 RepID=UPI0005EB84AB|nr:hypothetical protein [Methyloterricola oryzae]
MENHNIRFTTERFDYSSDLPEHYNAGNRFYGRDLAEFLATGLAAHQFPGRFFDEDWGWAVECQAVDGKCLEIGIYNLAYGGEDPDRANQWGLWLRMYETGKWLGFIPRRREIEVTPEALAAVHALLDSNGIRPEVWEDASA